MDARVSMIALGVQDLPRSVAFYRQLGWTLSSASKETIAFFQLAGGVVLSLYPYDLLAEDAQLPAHKGGFGGITLAQNQTSADEVDAVLARAVEAGGTLLKPGQTVFWGGYSGYFADPDGYPWEVAWNPFVELQADKTLILPA